MQEKEITIELKQPKIMVLLILLLGIFIMESQVILNTPIAFGDEGHHTRMIQWFAEEKEYPVWVPTQGTKLERRSFQRTPLFHLLEGGIASIIGFSEMIVKLLVPLTAMLTGISVFILVKKLYDENVAFIASIICATIPSFVTYSVLIYTDVLATFYFTLFFLTFALALRDNIKKYWILSGVFGSLALLTKMPAIMMYPIIFLVFFYELLKKRNFSALFKKYFVFLLLLILIPSTYFLRSLYYYGTPTCSLSLPFFTRDGCAIDKFEAKYSFEERTPEAGTEQDVFKMGFMNYIIFAYGEIWLVPLGIFCGLFMIFFDKNKTNILILITLAIFAIYFFQLTGRAEDTARYTLGWISIISLISAIYFKSIYDFIKKYQKYFAVAVFIFVIFFSFQNLKQKLDVMNQVKQFSPLFFEACDWVKANLPDNVLISSVWSSRAVYNCQRNTTGSPADIRLSNDLEYSLEVAEKLGITHLFIQKFSIMSGAYRESYTPEFVQFLENNPDHFVKIFENGPSLQQCLQQGGCDGNIIYEIRY